MMGAVAKAAMDYISKHGITHASCEVAAKLAADELIFGTNMRATAEYRRELTKTLVERSLMEVCNS